MRITFILLFCLALFGCSTSRQAAATANDQTATATAADGYIKTASIKTSASCSCGDFKVIIEKALADAPGVKSADVDVTTKRLKVKYNTAETTLDDIRKVVAGAGFDADDVAADAKGFAALPACCQRGHD